MTAETTRETIAHALHADDLKHGRAADAWEDMNAEALSWYFDNADAVLPIVEQARADAWDEGVGDVESGNDVMYGNPYRKAEV